LLTILAAAEVLERRWWRAAVCVGVTALVHPLMALFAASWLVVLAWPSRRHGFKNAVISSPLARFFGPANPAWREALARDRYFMLRYWAWYEWLGAVAPLPILYAFGRLAQRSGNETAARLSLRTALFGLLFLVPGVLVGIPVLMRFAPLQPMRSLHLVYFVMLLLAGGLLGRHVLRERAWRWIALYLILCLALYIPQRVLFSGGEHIEWPGAKPRNAWVQAFDWVRRKTQHAGRLH
jgi:hypothetical protein